MSEEKTVELLEKMLAGNVAWNLGFLEGAEVADKLKDLGGSASWNKLCFEQGVIWHPLQDKVGDIVTTMLLNFFIAWLTRQLGVKK